MKVIVIGAGISGLYAAYLLKQKGYEVTVLEASKRYGGRIRSVLTDKNVPIELGAEFIHGQFSLLKDFVEHSGFNTFRTKGKSYLFYKGKLKKDDTWLESVPELGIAFDFFDEFMEYRGHEITVDSYIKKTPELAKFQKLLKVFASEYGTENKKLGLRSLAATESKWSSGHKDFKVDGQMVRVLDSFVQHLNEDILFEKPVTEIQYDGEAIQVKTKNGESFSSDFVLVTVPISILQRKMIRFEPDLPAEKVSAIQGLGMDYGMKIVLKFKNRFWKKKMYEIWGTSKCYLYYTPFPKQDKEENFLIGYVTGEQAEYLGKLGNKAVDLLVNELDEIFGSNIASTNLIESKVMDWGKEPYILGMYSFDSPNSEGMRKRLAKPVIGKLYFAGEATNYNGHPATLHGAMETAERAVFEIDENQTNKHFLT